MSTEPWELEDNPSKFTEYNWYSDDVPARKFYLFIAEIGRRLRHLMTDPGPVAMIELCEQCAEGQITEDDISDLSDDNRPAAGDKPFPNWVADNLYYWVADRYKVHTRGVYYGPEAIAFLAAVEAGLIPPEADHEAIRSLSEHSVFASTRERTELEWGALVRDIYGPNPFRPVAFDPSWRTGAAVALAQQMYESRDFSHMPILADALQEAGCDSEDILNHCRDPRQAHVRGCWVVDLVLGKT